MFCWPCISIHPCNKNQLDALFILSLFRQLTATCFGHIYRPLSGGIMYTYSNWYVLCFSVDWLLANRESTEKHKTYQLLAQHIPNVSYVLCFSVDCWPTESQLKSTKRTNFWHNTYQCFICDVLFIWLSVGQQRVNWKAQNVPIFGTTHTKCFTCVVLFSWLSVGQQTVDRKAQNVPIVGTTRTSCCIYTVYLLMIGYKYYQNM